MAKPKYPTLPAPFILRTFVGALFVLLSVAPVFANQETTYLAFLEDHLIEEAIVTGRGKREAYEPAVRVAFRKTGNEWRSLCDQQAFIRESVKNCKYDDLKQTRLWQGLDNWNHELTAKTAGPVDPETFTRLGLLKTLTPTLREDFSTDRRILFGGHNFWAARKPFALASGKYSKIDPEGWNEVDLRTDVVPTALQEFVQREFGVLKKCEPDVPARAQKIQGELRMDLRGEGLRLRRQYRSQSRLELWQIEIPAVAIRLCGSEHAGRDWNEPRVRGIWVFRDRNGDLGTILTPYGKENFGAMDKFELIEHRDFDGDGRTELVFWYFGYMHDGYVMLFDGLTKLTTFTWGGN